jgi:DNA polymerase III subunit gamma/tau
VSQALYRRYRPETFADVIGQEHVTEPLQQALRTGRVNHAYLFSGPRGCGKTTSARILARCLNCDQGPTDAPCGVCDSCVALARGGAGTVDVIEIDAASHGGVDDARELRERASYGPAQSRYKVYIIDEAHMVTPQGFNALLKIVEEPPEHVKFVFATTEPEKVIGTIRSRTHHYPFRLVPPARLQDYLASVCATEGVPVESGVLSFVVRAGGGSVRDSLSVLDQLIAGSGEEGLTYEGAAALLGFTDAELLDGTVTAIAHGDAAAAFAHVDKVIETGLDPRRFVEDLLERLRDLIICAAVPDGAAAVLRGVPSDQLERMHVQAGAFGPGGLSRAADVVNAGLTEMTGATAPRLQLELIIARLLLPGAAGPQGFAARLDRIERRLDMGVREQVGAPTPQRGAGGRAPGDGPGGTDASPRHGLEAAPAAATPPTPLASPGAGVGGSAVAADPPATVDVPEAPAAPAPYPPRPVTSPATPAPSSPAGAPSVEPTPVGASAAAEPAPATSASVESPPVESAHATSAPVEAAPVESARLESAARPGALDHAAIVRAWPDILNWLSRHKRVTWTLVSASAQPQSFDGSRLILAIETGGLAETFRRGAHPAFVQEALMEVLGIDARVEGVAAGDARDAGRVGRADQDVAPIRTPAAVSNPGSAAARPTPTVERTASGPPSPAPVTTAGQESGAAAAFPGAAPPGEGGSRAASGGPAAMSAPAQAPAGPSRPAGGSPTVAPPPDSPTVAPLTGPEARSAATSPSPDRGDLTAGQDWSSAPPQAASAPSWATDGADPLERAPMTRTAAAATPPVARADGALAPARTPEIVDDPDSISEDDEDIEASGEIGQAVIERLLGGTVISEDAD